MQTVALGHVEKDGDKRNSRVQGANHRSRKLLGISLALIARDDETKL